MWSSGIHVQDTFTAEVRDFLDYIAIGGTPITAASAMHPGLAATLAAQTNRALGVPVAPEPPAV